MEALLRWQHPRNEALVCPSEFIHVAEQTGLIVPLSVWVLRTACRQATFWHRRGYPALRVAVNLSDRQLWRSEFVPQVAKILQETGMPPDRLEFEITERMALQNTDFTISVLESLSHMGIDLFSRRLRNGPWFAELSTADSGEDAQDRSVVRPRHWSQWR